MITTVLLDAGGVILDEGEGEIEQANIISRSLESIVPGYSVEKYSSDIVEAVKSFCPNVYACVIWKYSNNDKALFDKLFTSYRAEWRERAPAMRIFAGLHEEVRAISRGYVLGIAGQYGASILELLERESILECFTHRFTQDDFSLTKPDPRYYLQIADACGVNPEQCIMVGDRIDKDIIPAKQVGMRTILIRTGLHKNQQSRTPYEIPDMELPSVVGLASAINELALKAKSI